ncbi:acyltransferase family protein [Sphingomonas sp. Leaf343]|uniref:acyltransferase family protein n=1 Tax=Sphingomonas sp. Leaf343 TaxID=1736345 RepID=UPI0009EB3A79|nr:acyltransferase [Sphingomonas sp. Leaf343]
MSLANETIAERYKGLGTFSHGFDYLRIILAVAVVLQHSIVSSYGGLVAGQIWGSWTRIFLAPILIMFFGLSGFLVTGSLKKNPTATSFLTLRAVRLFPALAVEVFLSALIIGPIFTQFTLSQYFQSRYFWRYFTNILGHIHLDLAGVFLNLPFPNVVNLSLWTIPYELECYIAIIALYIVGVVRRRWPMIPLTIALIALGTLAAFQHWEPYWATNRPLPRSLVVAFLVGVTINLYSDRVRLQRSYALIALLAMIACTFDYRTVYLATIPAVYIVVYLGMMHPPKRGFIFSGDYSYGLYLFAFPIQQTYTALFPGARVWYANSAFTIVFGMIYAAFSWWCIEKPLLTRKHHFVRVAEASRDRVLKILGMAQHGRARPDGDRIG